MMMILGYLFVLLSAIVIRAAPSLEKRQSIRILSQSEIDVFDPYTHYASTGGCDPEDTLSWTCGHNCAANPTFMPTASGGNGASVQYWFVGYDPTLETVIVAHQGTDASKILPLITDASIAKRELNDNLFPGVSNDVKVHSGFRESQEDTASIILSSVMSTLSANSATKIVVTGWSLGAAIAMLDGLYLHLRLPSIDVRVVGYGMPRVGNQDWADYIDSEMAGKVTRINNKEDVVPILPFRFLGYHHVSGENHIKKDDTWVACPGQDNTNGQCIVGEVKNILDGSTGDHFGPYNGIRMGCSD